ncbi:hypothetical protein GCM10010992_27210 [Cloacibacterium rupense]|uniref:EpsG family protein n=2 Tax=Cloacibacterium rupense TaxID=517423 RepID=A0ABQ2NMI2_9FLAO|nr:hypothetical protein GCM10010992_27210 [Cloacibacterium rupense]
MVITSYSFLQSNVKKLEEYDTVKMMGFLGNFLLIMVLLYMGTRPVSFVFGDMINYADGFQKLQINPNVEITKDYLFWYFTKLCARIVDEREYFFFIATIYILPNYFFVKKYFKDYWFIPLLMIFGSFSFWTYGTNGLRNGMATSIFIGALCYYDRNKWLMYGLMALSYGVHNSLMIPIGAFLASGLYKKPKVYLYIWLAAIPLSLIGGGAWENFFGSIGLGDDRVNSYLTSGVESSETKFSSTGFRWDFVLYSGFAVVAGYYYIIKRGFQDQFYTHLWGTYMIANAFWILVIRANFSNRFAYLSWFMMAIVIAYPLFKVKFWPEHYKIVGRIFFAYYLFTYYMYLKS